MANRLKEKYTNEVIPALTEKFNYSSVMAVPKVDKIVINMGVGEAVNNAKTLEKAAAELALISGQKPLITKAKKSIAGFRLREGVVLKLPFVVNACTNSWINWYQYHFHVFVTSMVFQLNHLMDVVTTHLVLKNNLSSQKSTSTMLIKYVVWISLS